ncbi:MAG TPA: bifunctional serine/threonine protein kinase/MFS transporter [Phycisphaerae bacterium]|nr:bifunctional serine/threonine protein kinase/MFS transporter [Phycisphaerae bacterium]
MAFCFRQGDRPLPGYTIQRGIGRGGFGEVYYATSDGGKEVALKYLRDNPQVELRGVAHCLNLKSPHLVAVHDVKQNADGEYFVIMEYVSGPSLRDLLNTEAGGLGPQKAAYFLREIGKGLAYLHDRGIVHRDLKPGNIFYEDGYVKIGDYGLSKFMAASQHSGQTISVGTVHYMAPEVGSGNYDRTIDIYALGVILYEMLLGRVPFSGATMGEVLMKHLTAQPEVDELPEPFPRVIRKALQKDPKDRYQTAQEMVNEVFATEDLDRSVASFEPASLTTLAARAAKQAAVALAAAPAGPGGVAAGPLGTGSSNVGLNTPPPVINPDVTVTRVHRVGRLHDRISARMDAVVSRIDRTSVGRGLTEAVRRRGGWFEHVATALLVVVGLSWGSMIVSSERPEFAVSECIFALAVVVGVAVGGWLSLGRLKLSGKWGPRFVTAIATSVCVLPAYGITSTALRYVHSNEAGDWARTLLLSMILCDWPGRFVRGRRGDISLGSAFLVGLFGFIVGNIFDSHSPFGVAVVCAASSLAVQAIAGIWPLPRGESAAAGGWAQADEQPEGAGVRSAWPASPGVAVNPPEDAGTAGMTTPAPVMAVGAGPSARGVTASGVRERRGVAIRALWLFAAAILLCTAVMLFASTGLLRLDDEQFAGYIMCGVAASCYFLFALTCALRRYKAGLWRTLFRPFIFFSGLAAGGTAGVAMGLLADRDEQRLAALFVILAGAIVSLFVWFVPVPRYVPMAVAGPVDEAVQHRRTGKWLMVAGGIFLPLTAAAAVTWKTLDSSDAVRGVMPLVVVLLAITAVSFLLGGLAAYLSARPPRSREPLLTLPLRHIFDVGAGSDCPSLIERHMTVLGYTLVRKSDLLWSFVRGDWLAHLWDKDVRHWKTQVNIAAYRLDQGGHRLTCYLDVDAPFKKPDQKTIAALDGELGELEQLLGGRKVSSLVAEGAA